ncbi:non-ribosomal peptide synthetase [Neorhodopirellula pilleata]|uniref:Chondramide synthase cmdD n=1 Tax=Neorhodopirellula pilleata TaxID=2714738 RepID=A0A5C6AXH1_9BACT|nr:non-ribosomal peptide synthetase [Neorhodopirellula pilleata]TWU03766.1 Chondramide synthase cmdD [Neorhodopirellula pilleata]
MSDLEKRLDQLSPAKRALLERMILERGGQVPSRIPVRPADAPPELSGAEKRLWFVDQIAKDDPFYNMPLAADLHGKLDRDALQRAVEIVVGRHESLRTTYHLAPDGIPYRTVHDNMPVPCTFVDLSEAGQKNQGGIREVLKRRMRVAGRAPFDLENGPLLRIHLFRLDDEHHVIELVMHHIVSDGWSMIVMLRELTIAYEAIVASDEVELPELAIQYCDFAHWQNERLSDDRIESQMQFWRNRLAGAPTVLNLPIDRPRPAIQDFVGATVEFELSESLTRQINELAIACQTTPFVILMASEAVLLSRYCGQTDLVLGTASAGRVHSEIEPLIGFFVNTLPLRVELQPGMSFHELVQQIHESTLQAHENAEVPFEKLVEELAPTRDRSYSPIFQAALVMQNLPRDHRLARDLKRTPSLQVRPTLVDNGTAKYDLTFFLWEEDRRLIGHVEYRSALLDRSTIERMIDSYQTILSAVVDAPENLIVHLPVVSPEQRAQVIDQFNQTEPLETTTQLLHELIEYQATHHSQKVAVIDDGREFTFEQIVERAKVIAGHLIRSGVGRESAVVVRLPRSVDLITSILGILKAGGTFVPLDPELPPSRLQHIVEATDAVTIIDSQWLMNHGDAVVRDSHVETVFPEVRPTDRAYIIFTSGSTGTPKGVEIEHRSIVNFVLAQIDRMKVTSAERFMFGFSPSFDGAISEIFYSLSCGGTLVVVKQSTLLDPVSLTEFLNRNEVTVAKFPPALLAMLDQEKLPGLRTVASAGDKLTGELARRWLENGRCVFNGYGPTEVSVGCSMMPLHQNWSGDKPPIGRPMKQMRMYILDEHRQPLPIGVTGEIYIGGRGVGRGYLDSPEQTDAVFVDDPFARPPYPDLSHARMYRTGDLGRWLPEGVVEFVGRADDQVSLRGYRIEPAEIAAALEKLKLVRQAHVIQRSDRESAQIVAYVVPESDILKAELATVSETQHVSQWRDLFEQTHRIAPPVLDPSFNITGWVSTFTGQPIPTAEMREWADGAIDRITGLQPKRVLEIGCGTGLLLLRIAGRCEQYVGSDLLESSLDNIRKELSRDDALRSKVRLHHANADDFTHLGDAQFDCIVLNSVVQYFPSIEYLRRVLTGAMQHLRPGGYLFLGDIRNLLLQRTMAAAVEREHADPTLPISELKHRIRSRIEHEEELLIDPRWFADVQAVHPRLCDSRVFLKAAQADNELSQFRYDVVIRADEAISDSVLASLGATNYVTQDATERATAYDSSLQHLETLPDTATVADAKRCQDSFSLSPAKRVRDSFGPAANDPTAAELTRLLTKRLRDQLAERLPSYMVPGAMVVMDELPRTINGKIDRDLLPRPTGRPAWAGQFEAASTPTQRLLVEVWEELLDTRPIGIQDDFFELGGHSMLAVRMTSEVEKLTGQRLPLVAMFQKATVAHLATLIDQPELASAHSTRVPLFVPAAGSSDAPLFCVHPAGGTVFCYRDLAKELSGQRPVYGLQANGIDGNRPPHETLAEMAAHYARVIRETHGEGTVHLVGWSLGGNIAFEVARQLRKRGTPVGMVALLDSGLLSPDAELREEDFLPLLSALFPAEMNLDLEELRQKPQAEQLQFFIERASQAGIVPGELGVEQLAANNAMHVFGVFQANVKAVHQYIAEPYNGEVHLFRPKDQGKTNSLFDDPVLGWRGVTKDVHVHEVPGDHAHMLQTPAVTVLAEHFEQLMSQSS